MEPSRTIADVQKSVIQRAPQIDETIIKESQHVIQPIIHREIVKTEIRRIIQPIHEEITLPTQTHEFELPENVAARFAQKSTPLEDSIVRNDGTEPKVFTTYAAPIIKRVVLKPIIYEQIIPQIIEEIQPVIYRTIHEPHVITKQEDIFETVEIKTDAMFASPNFIRKDVVEQTSVEENSAPAPVPQGNVEEEVLDEEKWKALGTSKVAIEKYGEWTEVGKKNHETTKEIINEQEIVESVELTPETKLVEQKETIETSVDEISTTMEQHVVISEPFVDPTHPTTQTGEQKSFAQLAKELAASETNNTALGTSSQ